MKYLLDTHTLFGQMAMSIELKDNWAKGFAYDLHTIESAYMGVDDNGYKLWNNTRSEMGELVYRLKYNNDYSILSKIIDLIVARFKGLEQMDAIIPVPSSNKARPYQPVHELAVELGKRLQVKVLSNILLKQLVTSELKNIEEFDERFKQLQESLYIANFEIIAGKNVLLLDDLYRSGATLQLSTNLLRNQAKVKNVFVLTMTKTRSNR